MLALSHFFRTCLPSLWSPLFLLYAPPPRSDIPLSRQDAALAHLDSLPSHDLVIWANKSVPIPLAKTSLAYLLTAHFVTLRPPFPFRHAQFVEVFWLKPVCTILQALRWSRQHQQVCHFFSLPLPFDSRSVLSSVFPFTSNSLADLAETVFSLLLYYQAAMGARTFIFPRDDTADELARQGALLVSSAIPCSLSPLISCKHCYLFPDWRRTISSKFFDTQVCSVSTEELVLPRHACCVLPRLRCNGCSLVLNSYLSRIGRIDNPSCSVCGHSSLDSSHLVLHCLRSLCAAGSFCLYDLWSKPLGVAQLLGLHGLPPFPHPSEVVEYQQRQDEKVTQELLKRILIMHFC